MEAIDADDDYYMSIADKRGISVDEARDEEKRALEIESIKRENAEFKRAKEEADREAIVQGWLEEEKAVKQKFPAFDLGTELSNEDFNRLMSTPGMTLEHAYKVIHMDELMTGAMQYTAQQVHQQTVADIQARRGRPAEAGVASSSASAQTHKDAMSMSADEFKALRARVLAGEQVTL